MFDLFHLSFQRLNKIKVTILFQGIEKAQKYAAMIQSFEYCYLQTPKLLRFHDNGTTTSALTTGADDNRF